MSERQMCALPIPYWQDAEEGEAGGKKKKGAAAAPAAQQQQAVACHAKPGVGVRFVRSDCGSAFLMISSEKAAGAAAANTGGGGAQQFAVPVPYFAAV